MADVLDQAPAAANGSPPADWQVDKNGKRYVPRSLGGDGRKGIVYQAGEEETIEQAFVRDAQPKDERPRRSKAKNAKKPPAPPAKADLRELEALLAEALRSPAIICAAAGDEWSADHFTAAGPALARNLVVASDHNPWLRKKLEGAASGGDMAVAVMSMVGVAGAVAMYAIPPVVYWLNLPAPDKAREMFGIPQRKAKDAGSPPSRPDAAPAAPAAA
jgi:hypothetical protein